MKVFFSRIRNAEIGGKKRWRRRLIYWALMVFAMIPMGLYSQTSPLTFTQIPYSDPDIISPGRGAEQWDNGNERVNNPTPDTNIKSLDVYYRFPWSRLEGDSAGSYDWSHFNSIIRDAIDHRQKLSFGIMPVYDGFGSVEYDSAKSAYPLYLHQAMQADSLNERDWISNGVWIPNWNSPHYLTRLRALHEALYAHIMSSSYKGVAYKDAIFCIDIRGYGNYGEWHNAGIVDHDYDHPEGRRATTATLKKIIDHHTQVFDKWPLTIMIAAFDGEQFDAIMNPIEVGHYALTTSNAWGPLGWRRDQWGATDNYLDKILKHNEKKLAGGPTFGSLITSRFRTAPITGEPPNYVSPGGPCPYWDLERQLMEYGATSLGNGNWGVKTLSPCGADNARAAFKRSGYRIILEGGTITSNIVSGKPLAISLKWKNIGIAPTYENWQVRFEIRNSTNNLIWSGVSRFNPKLFLPASNSTDLATTISDNFNLPLIAPGNYTLNLVILDPAGYRDPLPLAIKGRNQDGSYTLKTIAIAPHATTTISGTIALQGRPDAPSDLLQVPLQVELYSCPDLNLVGVYSVTSKTSGRFTVAGVPIGTYTVAVKSPQTLQRVKQAQNLVAGYNSINFGTLLTGDVNDDNIIDANDVAILTANLNRSIGDSLFDPRADLNGNDTITIFDFSLLLRNYGQKGESKACDCQPPVLAIKESSCDAVANFTLLAGTGTGPYSLVISGNSYHNIRPGDTFGPLYPPSYRIWPSEPVPNLPSNNDGQSIEVGIKFRSSSQGYVRGIRFYNGANNSGSYTGNLYHFGTGELLASAQFISVSTNGWQYVAFPSPVLIEANTMYVASYFSSNGNYASNSFYFKSGGVSTDGLTVLADSISNGGSGLYKYGGGMPVNSYNGANYWVDVEYSPAIYSFRLTNVTDSSGCGNSGAIQTITLSPNDCKQKPAETVARTASRSINQKPDISRKLDLATHPDIYKRNYLGQNFPNPFNGSTTIQYSINSPSRVNLSVYDMNGRLVKILVNGSKDQGLHTLTIEAGSLRRGIYYYRIQAGTFTEVRKMIIQ